MTVVPSRPPLGQAQKAHEESVVPDSDEHPLQEAREIVRTITKILKITFFIIDCFSVNY